MDNKKGLVYTSLSKKNITIFIVAIIFISGILSYISLPKQQYPVVKLPMVIISAVYPGASAQDMEELVTKKIEDECMKAEGYETVRSDSYNSTSVVKVTFDKNLTETELQDAVDKLRNDIEALKENELPSGVTKLVYNDDAFETSGLILAFTTDGDESNEDMVQRAESLKDELVNVDGVNKVEVEGELEQQVKVTVDEDKLNHLNVSLAELSSIIGYQNTTVPVGSMEFDNDKLFINTSGKLSSLDEIKDIIISVDKTTGAIVRLKDVATVEMGIDEDSKKYDYNGKDAVILSLYFKDGVNVIDIGKNVFEKIDAYKETLPEDIHLDKVVYLPDDVSSSINDFIINLIESVVIVLLVVMVGMSVRNGTITSVVIPLTIFTTFVFMKLFNVDIQFVSLASLIIALGMLVSNAIVVSDAIQVRIDNDEDKFWACVNGAKEVAIPVLTSTLTTVVIFAVFYVLPGTMKRFVYSLPTIVIVALSASYIVSMLVTPVMCYLLMKKSKPRKNSKQRVRKLFSALLRKCMKHRILTIILSLVAVVLSCMLLASNTLEFVPNSDKMLLDITVTTNNFYDIRQTKEAVKAVEEILKSHDEIEYYLSSAGGRIPKYEFSTTPGTDAVNTGNVVVKINLDNSKITKDKSEFSQYLSNEINSKATGCKVLVKEMGIIPKAYEPVQVNICGDDFDTLNNAGLKAEEILRGMKGTKDVYSDRKAKTYDYYVDMKNNSLNASGLTKAEVQNELNIAVMGREATVFRKDSKEYPVELKANVKDIEDLQNLKVKSSVTANKHSVSQVANVSIKNDYTSVSRFNGKRCVTVSCDTMGGASPIETQIALVKQLKNMDLGNVTISQEGDYDTFTELMDSLGVGAAIGTMVVFLILYVQFYSFKRSLIVLISIPFALIGSAIGLFITGQNLSLFAIIGMISLIGVVVNNAIVLIDYMDNELKSGVSVDEACKTAVDMRFRPIMLSSVTTILGLLPLAVAGNVLFKGLSIAFMSGLTTSLFFTLVVIPVVYSFVIKEPVKTVDEK